MNCVKVHLYLQRSWCVISGNVLNILKKNLIYLNKDILFQINDYKARFNKTVLFVYSCCIGQNVYN